MFFAERMSTYLPIISKIVNDTELIDYIAGVYQLVGIEAIEEEILALREREW